MTDKLAIDRIAIFEELNKNTWPIIANFIQDGYVVFYDRIQKSLPKLSEIKQALEVGNLIPIADMVFEYRTFLVPSMISAHRQIDDFFEEFYSSTPFLKQAQILLNRPEVVDMYKKHILKSLQETYLLQLMVNEIISRFKAKKKLFCFQTKKNIHMGRFSLINPEVDLLDKSNLILDKIEKIFDNCKRALVPLYYLLKKFGGISFSNNKKSFQVGLNINHPKNIFLMNFFTESILIDKKELPKEKVLLIDESPGKINVQDYRKKGYNFDLFLTARKKYSIKLLGLIFFQFSPAFIQSLLFVFDEKIICYVNSKILADYILCHIFFDNYKVKNYVRWGVPENVSRYCLLNKAHIKTWFIYPDNTTCAEEAGYDEREKVNSFFAFMHYDYAVVYGNKHRMAFQQSRNSIGKYIVNGNLFAQIGKELKEGKYHSSLEAFLKARGIGKDKTIIGFFDSSYGNLFTYKLEDAEKSANDLRDLLDENPEMVILFKTKKEFSITPQVERAYHNLKQHDRCLFFERYNDLGISAPEVIAMSDLVITVFPSSPTMEAIVSHKKAFYYDINGSLRGDNFSLNRIPNLVAHGKQELNELIKHWLHNVDSEQMRVLQETYIKDEMDPYLDGKALSRLRNLLMDRSE